MQSAKGSWWANCAWCSAGVATLVGDVAITTTLGAETRQVTVRVENGKLRDEGLLMHFPIPMRQVWDNVIYTCSTMLLFDSEAKAIFERFGLTGPTWDIPTNATRF